MYVQLVLIIFTLNKNKNGRSLMIFNELNFIEEKLIIIIVQYYASHSNL